MLLTYTLHAFIKDCETALTGRSQWLVGNRCDDKRVETKRWRLINRHLVGSAEGHKADENCVSYFSTVVHRLFFAPSDIAVGSEGSQDDGGRCAITSYVSICVCAFVSLHGDAPVVLVITAKGRHKCTRIFSLQVQIGAENVQMCTHTHTCVNSQDGVCGLDWSTVVHFE